MNLFLAITLILTAATLGFFLAAALCAARRADDHAELEHRIRHELNRDEWEEHA